VTVIDSLTAANRIVSGTSDVEPRPTWTPVALPGFIPSSVALSVYGPPTRTLGMKKRPLESVTAEYRVPVGV